MSGTLLKKSPNNPDLFIPIGLDNHMVWGTSIGKKMLDMDYTVVDTITLDRVYSGNSSVSVSFTGRDAHKSYHMIFKDFIELIKTNTLVNGTLSGTWGFRKQGTVVGLIKVG